MLPTAPLYQESLERAKDLHLEGVIRSLASKEDQRQATRRQVEQRRRTLLRQVDDPLIAQTRLERILQGNELSDINYLARGVLCARSVCRVVVRRAGRCWATAPASSSPTGS